VDLVLKIDEIRMSPYARVPVKTSDRFGTRVDYPATILRSLGAASGPDLFIRAAISPSVLTASSSTPRFRKAGIRSGDDTDQPVA
jgi:hypothetical protein